MHAVIQATYLALTGRCKWSNCEMDPYTREILEMWNLPYLIETVHVIHSALHETQRQLSLLLMKVC